MRVVARGECGIKNVCLYMKDVKTCLFSDGNYPVEKRDNCRYDVE